MKLDTLNNLNIDESAYIVESRIKSFNKQNITNLGVTEGSKITCLYKSPFGDPTAYEIKNVILAIRNEDSKNIIILRKTDGSY